MPSLSKSLAGLLFFSNLFSTLSLAQSCSHKNDCEPGSLCIDRFCINLNATTINDDRSAAFANSTTKSRH